MPDSSSSQPEPGRFQRLARALRTAAPQPSPLFNTFREDRVLAVLFALLSVSAIAPVFTTPFLPLVDVAYNAHAGLLPFLATGDDYLSQFYEIRYVVMPYWAMYCIQACFTALFGGIWGVKCVVMLSVVLLPLSVMRLLIALEKEPRLALLAFILVWDKNMYWGWLSFQLGMIMCIWCLARLVELRTWRDALRMLPWTALVGLSQPHAIVMLAVGGAIVAVSNWGSRGGFARTLGRTVLALSGTMLTVGPWLMSSLGSKAGDTPKPLRIEWVAADEKLASLFNYALGNYVTKGGIIAAATGFVVLLVLPLILSSVTDARRGVRNLSAYALLISGLLLYAVLPFAFWGPVDHWWTYPRFATYILLGMVVVPRVELPGLKVAWLGPGVAAAVAIHASTFSQFSDFGKRAAPFLEIIDALPEHSKFISIELERKDPAVKDSSMTTLHGYAAIQKKAYDPHLFDVPFSPVGYRVMYPHPHWKRMKDFRVDKHGKYYDYIIVMPAQRDFLKADRAAGHVSLVKQAGMWQLYKVTKPLPYTGKRR